MFKHLRTKLAAEWHKLVTGTEDDCAAVLAWIEQLFERDYDMTLEEIGVALTSLAANMDALATPTDTAVLAAIADLKAELVAKVEGVVPAPSPAPVA